MQQYDSLITHSDHRRLRSLAARLRSSGRARMDHIAALTDRLRRSELVNSKLIPRNVVTLNSRVALKDLDSGDRLICTVADPHDVTLFGDRLSAASPGGLAVLGKRVGQIIRWKLGSKIRRFRIEQVLYQPEAMGDFHL
jgi:regulator of nucleoside diphosphate kinase